MPNALVEVRGLARAFHGVRALAGTQLDMGAGTIAALIRPDGAGEAEDIA